VVKRTIIILGAVLLISVVYVFASTLLSSDNGEPAQQSQQEQPTARPWSGKSNHIYNSRFSQQDQTVTLETAFFDSLQKKKANVRVFLSVPAVRGKLPKWVSNKAFFGYQAGVAKKFKPDMKVVGQGAQYRIILTFSKVPSLAFGPTCKMLGATSSPVPLSLNFPGFIGDNFAVVINAPPAPPGHCFSEPQPRIKKQAKIKHVRAKKGKVTVSGKTKGKFLFVKVAVRGKKNLNQRVRVVRHTFKAKFDLPKGKYVVRSGYGFKIQDTARFRVRR